MPEVKPQFLELLSERGAPCPVLHDVVERDVCVGCGFCAAVCPTDGLEMVSSSIHGIVPEFRGDCIGCDKCLKACPFSEHRVLPDKIPDVTAVEAELSYFSCFGGHVVDHAARMQRTSGGLLTELLCHLRATGQIDAAVIVGDSVSRHGSLFHQTLTEDINEIRDASGSKYCVVHSAKALRQILRFDGKVAFVGLPCQCTALKQAQKIDGRLRRRVKYSFALTCGHQVTPAFTEFCATMAGGNIENATSIEYREKVEGESARNFSFKVRSVGGESRQIPFRGSGYGTAWRRRMFRIRACDFCPDVFGDDADATFMDAWVAPHEDEPGGTSFVVSRCSEVDRHLKVMAEENAIHLWEESARKVVKSQLGILRHKHELLPSRIDVELEGGRLVPVGWERLSKRGTWRQRYQAKRYSWIEHFSKLVWGVKWIPNRIKAHIILSATSPSVMRLFALLPSRRKPRNNQVQHD